jgi:hypothetical protein
MKCIHCGYFNLPQALTCGRCGMGLTKPLPHTGGCLQESLYPPRARERTLGMQVEARLGLAIPRTPPSLSVRSMRPWLITTAALLPGAGHFLLGRVRTGVLLLTGAAALAAAILLTLHSPVSDLLAWLLLAIVCGSAWDAARHSFPDETTGDNEARFLREMRLICIGLGTVAGTLTGAFWLATRWYPLYDITTDAQAPVLKSGDELLTRAVIGSSVALHRGMVVTVASGEYPIIERIVGLAGDRVQVGGGALFVNGRRAEPDALPLSPASQWGARPYDVSVPPGEVCLWTTTLLEGDDGMIAGLARAGSFTTYNSREVTGQPIAVLEPPARRKLLR